MTIRQILLVGHTHHDVGYTNSPRIIDRMHARIVDEILALSESHAAAGPDQFRWTFEVARPVLGFLQTANPADAARLRRLVEQGRVSVTGGYLNMTQLPGEAEFDAAYEQLVAIRATGIPVRTEQHGDVNGIAWGTVPAMRRAGLDRLVMALNPDHGRAPFTQPTGFWWEGPDRKRIFVWLSTHYGFGEEWGIVDGDVRLAERSIRTFLEQLNARDDYPYDAALVHAANDNRWPTALFLDVVRHWNAEHPEVPMRTATIDDALDILVEQGTAAGIPVVSGEWSDWWSHGHGSTAREVATYRQARSFALAAQAGLGLSLLRGDGDPALATVLGYRRGPVRLRTDSEVLDDLAEVDEQLLLFGEHTWGSWETYSKPHSTFSHSHWNAMAGFAYAAYDFSRDLAVEGLFRMVASGGAGQAGSSAGQSGIQDDRIAAARDDRVADRVIAVVNPTERARTEPVTVEVDGTATRTLVATVPAFGTAVLPIPEAPRQLGTGTTIQTESYRVAVDPERGGAVSIVELRSGRELVDQDAGHGLGALIVERVPEDSAHPMVTDPKRFHPEDPGPEFVRQAGSGRAAPKLRETDHYVEISWRTSAPTVPRIDAALRLYRELDIIDLELRLSKPEVFEPESIFVAFPFAVSQPEFLLETAGAVYLAETEQLPDTSKDWYSIQHAVGLRGSDGGVLWGSFDAPLVQLGGFQTGRWARTLDAPAGHINSWLMNNLHFT
ncbi:MAG: glycoside hydrolase family 38 N-terminal domain-containing protein, partial [Microbacteriaceae bacterium]